MKFKKFILAIFAFLMLSISASAQKPFVYKDGNKTGTFTATQLKDGVFGGLITNIKQLNAQLPIQIDDFTEMYSAVLNGTTINYNYTAYIDSSLLSDADIKEFCDEIKAVQKENLKFLFKQNSDKMPVSEWIRLYRALGIKYHYNYIDANRKAFAKIVIDLSDM